MSRVMKVLASGGLAVALAAGMASQAVASQDIPWTWNSSDHDVKAKFQAYGDLFRAYEYEGNDYLNYQYDGNTGLKWYVPGSEAGTEKYNDIEMRENKAVAMQVCETKTGLPDDCSGWKYGVS